MIVIALLAAAAGQQCVDFNAIRSRHAESGSSVIFDMFDGSRYRNTLGGRCPGLANANNARALALETQAGRVCRGDRIRVVDHTGSSIPCVLGYFEQIEPAKKRD